MEELYPDREENIREKTTGESPEPKKKDDRRRPKPQGIAPYVTGDFLLGLKRWYPLAIWCCLLIFISIAQNFYFQSLQNEEISTRLELNRERSRAVVFSSMRLTTSRPSYIIEQVKERGIPLEESTVPPKKLVIQ